MQSHFVNVYFCVTTLTDEEVDNESNSDVNKCLLKTFSSYLRSINDFSVGFTLYYVTVFLKGKSQFYRNSRHEK